EDAIESAERRYISIASGNAPDNMSTFAVEDNEISVIDLLTQTALASSSSDARRLIIGDGIKLDGETITNLNEVVRCDSVISRGKNKFVRVVFQKRPK
ncbi:MAG: hypothetical protein FWH49_04950, partial [Clostridiales bacterium]|nr:hypothetical protein [Clostridiales bacterium]